MSSSSEPGTQEEELDVFKLWDALWGSRWLILGITGAFVVAAALYGLLAAPWYSANVLLSPAKEKVPAGLVGQLGNLILVPSPLNTKLDNKPFKEKKEILEVEGVSIPLEFVKLDDITPEAIKSRTANLADQAYRQVWKI